MLAGEQERLILWGPVAVVVGAGLGCSSLAVISPWAALAVAGLVAALGLACQLQAARRDSAVFLLAAMAGLLGAGLATGVALARFKSDAVAAPIVAGAGTRATITGTVTTIDRSGSGKWRVTIAVAALEGLAPEATPQLARITLVSGSYGNTDDESGNGITVPAIGASVSCKARLNPPPGQIVPGAFDFARMAWFNRLGAVGYVVGGCEHVPGAHEPEGWGQWLRARQIQAARYLATGGTDTIQPGGGLLAAIATGDRSWLTEQETEHLQLSGLQHIVSVSGLHVAMVDGLLFVVLWRGLALWPWLALRWDVRKIGAVVGLLAASAYAIFTGGEAPAMRAVLMVAIATGALLLNRKAITMRGLAIAALLIVITRPESAVEPGFQMSFLATMALVAMWEVWPRPADGEPAQWPVQLASWLAAALGVSLAASLATAPVAAAEFGRVSQYGVLANLLAGPIQEFVVGPAAVIAALLSPLGLDQPFWWLARWGLMLVLEIGAWVAAMPGAAAYAPWTGGLAPALLIAAVIWLCLWRTRLRIAAFAPALVGLALWVTGPQPVGWIAPGGTAILAAGQGQQPRLCRAPGPNGGARANTRFDATRLLDEARIDTDEAARLLKNSGKPRRDNGHCRALGQGWEAGFTAMADGADPHLLVMIAGEYTAIRPDDLPGGGLVLQQGNHVWLHVPPLDAVPWRQNTPETEN